MAYYDRAVYVGLIERLRCRRRVQMPLTSPESSLTFLWCVTTLSANANQFAGFQMFATADLALYDRSGRLTAVAEIKNKHGTSREWAAQTRRNILAHGRSYRADFFLLVTPDRLYVWKGAGTEPLQTPPTYEADTKSGFAPYFESAGVDPRYVSGHAFELLVGAWLGDLIRSEETAGELGDDQNWLAKSGLRSAVKGGRIKYEAVL